jgi:hypothetical protein
MHTCIWRLTYLLLSSNYCTFLPLFSGLFALFLPTSFAKSLVYNCSFLPPGSFDRRSGFRHVVFVNQNLSPGLSLFIALVIVSSSLQTEPPFFPNCRGELFADRCTKR